MASLINTNHVRLDSGDDHAHRGTTGSVRDDLWNSVLPRRRAARRRRRRGRVQLAQSCLVVHGQRHFAHLQQATVIYSALQNLGQWKWSRDPHMLLYYINQLEALGQCIPPPRHVFTSVAIRIRIYTVSQKTSHLWLAITLTHMNRFWYFLAEMLPIK